MFGGVFFLHNVNKARCVITKCNKIRQMELFCFAVGFFGATFYLTKSVADF